MRVIGGSLRSRKIKEVKSDKTRPTTDRNREALFNILGQYFSGGKVLDLFSGSGALGIEAISRGIAEVDFVDNQALACKTIKSNLQDLGIVKQAKVFHQDCFAFLKNSNKSYDLILADPPYALNRYSELLQLIVYGHLIADNGIIVFEADSKTLFPESFENWSKYREKRSGNTSFAFYRMED